MARTTLRDEIRLSWDGDDPWGSAPSALGGLCDVLHHLGEEDLIPASAGYRPGLFGPPVDEYPAESLLFLYRHGYVDLDALAYFARVLDRYADLVPEDRRY